MGKIYTALGLMSGTSLDGVDFSIIQTDGKEYLSLSGNNYIEFSNTLRQKIREIKSKITSTNKCKEIIKNTLWIFKIIVQNCLILMLSICLDN